MCIEPFRVPLAGKVAHCLFDKTGTLTPDQLVPHGVVNTSSEATPPPVVPISGSAAAATLVLAACHSIVSVASPGGIDPTLAGDPIELAALQGKFFTHYLSLLMRTSALLIIFAGIAWNWNSDTSVASPGNTTAITKVPPQKLHLFISSFEHSFQARKSKEERLKQLQSVPPTPATQQVHSDKVKALSDAIAALDHAAVAAKESAQRSLVNSVRVLQRHHFSSALQRMSVVVSCQGREPYSGLYCLVKGSPEALLPLMDPSQVPKWWVSPRTTQELQCCSPQAVQVHIVLRIACSQRIACAFLGLQACHQRPC
jgi:cation-transporting ATPase 13A1